MTLAVASEASKCKRNWKKIWFFVCMCAVAIGLLFAPLWKGETVRFLAGVVLGLAIGGIFREFSNGHVRPQG
jgi:uncharacterized membrane protein YjjP (DUF1212 family)